MVPLASLWLPILLSAVIVFIASSIIHMVLPYHRNDMRKVPAEDEAIAAFRRLNLAPGDYAIPYSSSPKEMKEPAFQEKVKQGPIVFMTVQPGGIRLGTSLVQWFLYSVVVAIFAAYIAGRALAPGAAYLEVFRFAGTTTFVGYALALWQMSIWWKRSWTTTLKSTFDSLIYAGLVGGTFGWLWPS